MNYQEALQIARDLIGPNRDIPHVNSEYIRGQVELLADLFPIVGDYMADRKVQIARDLGLPEA